jgi:hypothetical protein
MNREKSGGKTLADHYRDHGVNMLAKSARYPKAPGETSDKGGPQPVEPIVDEMLERMVTGASRRSRPARTSSRKSAAITARTARSSPPRRHPQGAVLRGDDEALRARRNASPMHSIASVRVA